LPVWKCPSAPANRIQEGWQLTVMPPPRELFTGTAACGDYAGMGSIDPGLESSGLIDPSAGPRNPLGQLEGLLPLNAAKRLAEITDGTSNTTLYSEAAGRHLQYFADRSSTPLRQERRGPSGPTRTIESR